MMQRRNPPRSLHRQAGYVGMGALIPRWFSGRKFRVQDLFRGATPGVHFETYDPNSILKRTNLATNTGFTRGTTGATPTDYIERGLVTGRKTADATTSSGFVMRVTSGGGSTGASDDVRHGGVTGLSVGTQYTIRFKAKRAPGFTNSNLQSAFGGVAFGPQVLTDNYQTFSYAVSATGTQHSLFFGGPAGALYDVTDVEVVKTADVALPYQAVTDWNTEFMAAGGDRVTMFQDNTCATPLTSVEQTIGGFISSERGTGRGPELATVSSANGVAIGGPALSTYVVGQQIVQDRWYEILFTVSNYSGTGTVGFSNFNNVRPTANGTYRYVVVAANNASLTAFTRDTNTCNYSNITCRLIPGSVATQSTAGFRPKLEARVNLLLKTEQLSDAAWTKSFGGTGVAPVVTDNYALGPDGRTYATRVQLNKGAGATSADQSQIAQAITGANVGYQGDVWIRTTDGATKQISVTVSGVTATGPTKSVDGTWQRFTPSATVANSEFRITLRGTFGTSDSADLLVWHPDLRTAADAALDIPAYQRVNTASDYDTEGFPHRCRGDGIDDYLSVPLNMSTTDKLTAWVSGSIKASDATSQALFEFTGNSSTTAGSFGMVAPVTGTADVQFRSTGSAAVGITKVAAVGSRPAPLNAVVLGAADIGGDSVGLQINGVDEGSPTTTDQGAGNYANDTLYILRRAGSTLPSGAGFCALTIRGAASDARVKARMLREHARLSKIKL